MHSSICLLGLCGITQNLPEQFPNQLIIQHHGETESDNILFTKPSHTNHIPFVPFHFTLPTVLDLGWPEFFGFKSHFLPVPGEIPASPQREDVTG